MRISGFEDMVSLDEFVYCIAVDKHEECRFTLSITEKYVQKCKSQLGKECIIENDDFRFQGTVTGISSITDISGITLSVVVHGDTIAFDTEHVYRIFQKKDKTVSDILKNTSMSEVVYQASEDVQVEPLIVQHNETDWNFMLRMSEYLGKHIFPGEKKWIGDPKDSSLSIEDNDIIAMNQSLKMNQCELLCTLKKKLEFGNQIIYEGLKYYVDCIWYEKIDEIYTFRYHLKEIENAPEKSNLPTYDLIAVVNDNNDPKKLGRIKVEFLQPYEDVMKSDAMWIECDSIFATKDLGIVCIPSVEDTVMIHVYDTISRVQSVKRTEAYGNRYQDCNTKYVLFDTDTHIETNGEKFIFNNTKFQCEISQKEFIIKFGDKIELRIDEEGIVHRNDECDVRIENNRILFNADKTDIELASGIKIRSDNIGIDGKNKFDMTASKVNIKGTSGVSIN